MREPFLERMVRGKARATLLHPLSEREQVKRHRWTRDTKDTVLRTYFDYPYLPPTEIARRLQMAPTDVEDLLRQRGLPFREAD